MSDSTFVFCLIGVAAVLMVSNRVRFDFVALLMVVALILSGVLSVGSALSGFGSPVVVVIAGLLVVGEMVDRTGIARAVGDWILRRGGKNEIPLLVLIMISAALLSSVMSSTAVVAVFIPIVIRIAAKTGLAASRILIPMSFASLIGGMMILISTSPNLVVNGELIATGFEGLGFFSFSLIGLAVLGVAVIYVVVFGRHLLPGERGAVSTTPRQRTMGELWMQFRAERHVDALEITAESPLSGLQLGETDLQREYGILVLTRVRRARRGREAVTVAAPAMELKPGDLLVVAGGSARHERVVTELKLRRFAAYQQRLRYWMWEIGMAAVLIHPDSGLIGQSVTEIEFRTRYGLQAIGLRHGGESMEDFEHRKLAAGDAILLYGPWTQIEALKNESHDFVVIDLPPEHGEIVPAYKKAPVALMILGVMVLLSALEVVPLVVSVLGAAMAAVLTGCLSAAQAYRSIHWSSLVLVAGMLPLADALQQTGGSALIVEMLLDVFGNAGPSAMLTVIFALTAALSMFLSNTAAAVLTAPIAITAAHTMQVSPYPLAIAVLIAASAAYSTPVSSPVVTLVVEPGRYTFADFVKVGVPLLVLTWLVTVLMAPLLFPY